ncbi:MAG: membrane protein insertase YidC [Methylobacteriaceae bacterium]|jgi:YidC/Oxa1 family membrane protein insertase|nr:membrane protein insertase YidC [Methylobacteriaceae bacterium]
MGSENKNLLLAVILSLGVIFVWQTFIMMPEQERQQQAAELLQSRQTGEPGGTTIPGVVPASSGASVGTASVATTPFTSRDEALKAGPRVRVDTPSMEGSINLEGARFDDVKLKKYRATIDPNSSEIILFSPKGTSRSYFASFGWLSAGSIDVPGEKTLWTSDNSELTPQSPVTLTWTNPSGVVFQRKISVDDKALFTIEDTVNNPSASPLNLYAYGLLSRLIPRDEVASYGISHEGAVGSLDNKLQEYPLSKLEEEKPVEGRAATGHEWKDVTGGYVGITEKYWASAIIPNQDVPYTGVFSVSKVGDQKFLQSDIMSSEVTVPAAGSASYTLRLFAGAKEVATIDGYWRQYNITFFDKIIDWGWFYYITKPLFLVLNYFHQLFGNFGLSILFVTVLLKILFLPLANRSYVSMAKMKMLQPEMNLIKERYKDDKQEQQKAMMALWKKEKINPAAGCWPMFIQIPVFFALYKVLFVTIEMRHAPFYGWVHDLAAPDPTCLFNLFGLLPYDPLTLPTIGPIISDYARLGVWPLLMGMTMWLQMKMNPEPTDPVQKQMFGWMPIIFTFMLGSFSVGLVIYWTWNNFLSLIQQGWIMKRHGAKIELWSNLSSTFKRNKKDAPAAK